MSKKLLLAVLVVCWTASAQGADLSTVQTVLEKYESIRRACDLTVYRLDWASTLQDAKARAAREQRPIFFIVVTNSYGNMYSGHC